MLTYINATVSKVYTLYALQTASGAVCKACCYTFARLDNLQLV